MFGKLSGIGRELAQKFIESGQDIFSMTTEIEGQDVSVTVKFAPQEKRVVIRPEGVWNMLTATMSK